MVEICPIAKWPDNLNTGLNLFRYSGHQLHTRHLNKVQVKICFSDVCNADPDGDQVTSVQWGSEIRTRLDFKWSKRGWVANGVNFEWDLKFGSSTIRNPDKWPPFCKKKPIEVSGFRMNFFEQQ